MPAVLPAITKEEELHWLALRLIPEGRSAGGGTVGRASTCVSQASGLRSRDLAGLMGAAGAGAGLMPPAGASVSAQMRRAACTVRAVCVGMLTRP